MRDKLIAGRIAALVLLGTLAAVGAAYTVIPIAPASAAPASQTGGHDRASEWAEADELASAGGAPTLTNDVMEPEGGAGSQLLLGFGLLGLGLLGLVYGLAAAVRNRPGDPTRPDAQAGRWPRAEHPRADLPGAGTTS